MFCNSLCYRFSYAVTGLSEARIEKIRCFSGWCRFFCSARTRRTTCETSCARQWREIINYPAIPEQLNNNPPASTFSSPVGLPKFKGVYYSIPHGVHENAYSYIVYGTCSVGKATGAPCLFFVADRRGLVFDRALLFNCSGLNSCQYCIVSHCLQTPGFFSSCQHFISCSISVC